MYTQNERAKTGQFANAGSLKNELQDAALQYRHRSHSLKLRTIDTTDRNTSHFNITGHRLECRIIPDEHPIITALIDHLLDQTAQNHGVSIPRCETSEGYAITVKSGTNEETENQDCRYQHIRTTNGGLIPLTNSPTLNAVTFGPPDTKTEFQGEPKYECDTLVTDVNGFTTPAAKLLAVLKTLARHRTVASTHQHTIELTESTGDESGNYEENASAFFDDTPNGNLLRWILAATTTSYSVAKIADSVGVTPDETKIMMNLYRSAGIADSTMQNNQRQYKPSPLFTHHNTVNTTTDPGNDSQSPTDMVLDTVELDEVLHNAYQELTNLTHPHYTEPTPMPAD